MSRQSKATTAQGAVHARSEHMCEAMIPVRPGIYGRCWGRPVETHHMLTRARGGAILDRVMETYHLIDLCPKCHAGADGADAYAGGLLIDGYVSLKEGKPYYQGSDSFLRQKYGDDEPWEPGTGMVKKKRSTNE